MPGRSTRRGNTARGRDDADAEGRCIRPVTVLQAPGACALYPRPPVSDDIDSGSVFRLPSDRCVRVVGLKGPIATCVYCTEAGEPDLQDGEAAVSLNISFLRRFGHRVIRHASPTDGRAE